MTVSCPECTSVFRVDPSKVPATGVRARCSVCGGVIAIAGGTLLVSVTPTAGAQQPRLAPEGSTMTPPLPSIVVPPPVQPSPFDAVGSDLGAEMGGRLGTPAEGKRPINPFLRAEPTQRARRLARALVSDLVAYHPQKRDEGLRDGTLRQLFRAEIRKSYEEYVEQVGRDVAEQSPFFQDALNDILAGGRRLF
jgi:predicted Zn finger-like uncharacterized protein